MSDQQLPPPGPPVGPRYDATPYPTSPGGEPATGWAQPSTFPGQPVAAPNGLGTATIVLSGVVLAVQAMISIAAWPAGRAFAEAGREGRDALTVTTSYDVISFAFLPALVAAYIVTCLWLGKARSNAERLSPGTPHQRGRVWVWLGWWVPIVSLWFPFQVVRDVELAGNRGKPSTAPLGSWWTCWLIWAIGNRVASRLVPVAGVPDPSAAAALGLVETILTIAMAIGFIQWMRLIRSINRAQEELAGQTGLPR